MKRKKYMMQKRCWDCKEGSAYMKELREKMNGPQDALEKLKCERNKESDLIDGMIIIYETFAHNIQVLLDEFLEIYKGDLKILNEERIRTIKEARE